MTWPQVKLNEAYWFQEGPGVRKWQFTTSGIKLLNVGNITKDRTIDLSKTDRHLSLEEVEKKYSHFLADEGDLVIASSGISIDYDGFLRTRGAFIRQEHLPLCMNTSTIRFKGTEGVSDLGFLRHWLDSFEFRSQISREVTGIAQKNFGPSHLKRIKIALPPLEEQKRIAGILDAADILRAKRREALAKLDDLLQSTFFDLFGDPAESSTKFPTTTLGIITKFIDYRGISPNKQPEGVRLVTARNIKRGWFEHEPKQYIPTDEYNSWMSRGMPRTGDVLFTTEGHTLGSAALLPYFKQAALAQRLIALQPTEQICSEYLLYIILDRVFQNEVLRRATGSAAKGISSKQLASILVPLPPLDLQQRFAEIVSSVEEQKAKMRKHLAQLDDLFASLQQRAFRGDL